MKTLLIRAQARNGFEIAMASLALLYLLLFAGIPLLYNVVLSFQNVDLMSPAFLVPAVRGDCATTLT